MSSEHAVMNVAMVGQRDGEQATAAERLLSDSPGDVRWYHPRDVDKVYLAVREGRVQRVVFARAGDLLEALWDGDAELGKCLARGVRIESVETFGDGAGGPVDTVVRNWQRWEGRLHRQRVVAGLVLSLAALAAAFVLHWSLM